MMLPFFFLLACAKKPSPEIQSPPIEKEPPILQKDDTPPPVPIPQGLPSWEDLEPPNDVYQPVEALALSHDYTRCFKEWFQGDSLPPSIRKFGGRILEPEEGSIGRLILCPEDRKTALLTAIQNEKDEK